MAQNRVEVNVYAATSAGAHQLADAIRVAPLQAWRGDVPGGHFASVVSNGSYEQRKEMTEKGNRPKRFIFSRDYLITYTESTDNG